MTFHKETTMSSVNMEPSWMEALGDEFQKPYILELRQFLHKEQKEHTTYPTNKDIFTAFWTTPFDKVRVVILGQDPYHGPGQAHGLSFSVQKGVRIPPSLRNIYKELKTDLNITPPSHGNLIEWAQRGVLLLNTILTVRHKQAGSHQKKGWEQFTDRAIQELNDKRTGLIFILWGSKAQAKISLINQEKHFIIRSVHPSPMSAQRGFHGSKPFSKANDFLKNKGDNPIDWRLSP
jgi:uracil-DNA glycosylase